MKKLLVAVALGFSFLSAGCASTLKYNPVYIPNERASTRINGAAALVMTQESQNFVFTGNPTSFTGSATTLTLPIGEIAREVGLVVLGRSFENGAAIALSSQDGKYNAVVSVSNFSYQYNQMQNLGMAITPKVTLSLNAVVTDPDGKELLRKTYNRTDFKGDTYMASTQPAEKINAAFHKALTEMLNEMVTDIANAEKTPIS